MYLQCEYVTARTARDFLTFCECWSEMLHNHHQCEEAAYFPIIERAVGEEGLAESNTDEHEVPPAIPAHLPYPTAAPRSPKC